METLQFLRFWKKLIPLRARVRVVASVLPRPLWYFAARFLSRMQIRITRLIGRKYTPLHDAMMLDYWLIEFTKLGAFPIPYRTSGTPILHDKPSDRNGVVYVGLHLPACTVSMRALEDLKKTPDLSIASSINIDNEGKYPVVGLQQGFNAIQPGPAALLKARRLLAQGGVVASMLDSDIGTPISDHLLRLAGKSGARVILFWSEVSENGSIEVRFAELPYCICDADWKVSANLSAIFTTRERILTQLSLGPKARPGQHRHTIGRVS